MRIRIALAFVAVVLCAAPLAAQPMEDAFFVGVDPFGTAVGGGSGYGGGQWYLYEFTGWWNEWFYNGPYRPGRKHVHIEFDIVVPGGFAEVALNWATPEWSALGQDRPPLPQDLPDPTIEDLFIAREPFHVSEFTPAPEHVVWDFELPYCPEWISIDVRGAGFEIIGGWIYHECFPEGPDDRFTATIIDGVFSGEGTGYSEPGGEGPWFYYENFDWWNIWFPNEFDLHRQKRVRISMQADFLAGGWLTLALNYATPEWTGGASDRPPLPEDVAGDPTLEEQLITREIALEQYGAPGPIEVEFILPYCPAWVSVDIRGNNVILNEGRVEHECLELPGDRFAAAVRGGDLVWGAGNGYNDGDGPWYFYPFTGWWNQWWPNEFDQDRQKLVRLTLDLAVAEGSEAVAALNWATPEWQPPIPAPPLPGALPDPDAERRFIVRQPVGVFPPGHRRIVREFLLPYCPSWVSIDVQGGNFRVSGMLEHVCLPPRPPEDFFDIVSIGGEVQGGGTGYRDPFGDFPWFRYPNDPDPPGPWWNQWFYNGLVRATRPKLISLEADASVAPAGVLVVALNWSWPEWSAPPLEWPRPPLPRDVAEDWELEQTYIGRRVIVLREGGTTGRLEWRGWLPICPAWVSVDVAGVDFEVMGGVIRHECPPYSYGDLNCDGATNGLDIDPFVIALTDPAAYAEAYPGCYLALADCYRDGAINGLDIDPFVRILTGPPPSEEGR